LVQKYVWFPYRYRRKIWKKIKKLNNYKEVKAKFSL
jgi:hypothetical protein